MRIHLRGDGGEEATAGEDAVLHVPQKSLAQLAQPLDPRGSGRCGLDHLLGEQRTGRLDGGQLELLLGAEVREEAALAHPDRLGQAADREAAEALDRRELRGFTEDRVTAAAAVAARGAHTASGTDRRLGHHLTN